MCSELGHSTSLYFFLVFIPSILFKVIQLAHSALHHIAASHATWFAVPLYKISPSKR